MPHSSTPDKRRIIVDYQSVTPEILALFSLRYPYGYDEEDVLRYKNSRGETVRAVPFETEDTRFLIKVGVKMDARIDAFLEDMEEAEGEDYEHGGDAQELDDD